MMFTADDVWTRIFIPPPKWHAEAACRNSDPELFFPNGRGQHVQATARAAKAICARCPVTAECLDYALANKEYHGIWGGLVDKERRVIARRRRLAG